ncbi:hypothetical protein V6N12_058456 [Hibiscus sabdariffa]|uniref:KIB1-4 beta-propeller domain-containing protein n=1 Tax=Hibiscus sabdariffa TaxID=183260 RepID=A0ABR2ESM3_9ROSI
MCFTSPPTSPDCMVFGIDDDYPIGCLISTLRRGEFCWRHVRYQEYTAKFYSPQSNPVFHNGAFYCSDIDGKLGVYDTTTREVGGWNILDKLRFPCNGLFYSLASHKFHSFAKASAKNDLYNTKRMLPSVWITPTASEIYTEDDLIWFPNPGNFIPSSGRVTAKAAPQAYPSFVLTNLEDSNNQLLFNMFDRCHNAEGTPEIYRMRTVASAFGWLFQSRDRVGFAYCRPNENKWTIVAAKKSDDLNYDGISNVIGFQGKIYGLRHNSDLLEIDFDPIVNMVRGVWDGVHLPLASLVGTMDEKTYMVESCGELFTIRINFLDDNTVNPSKITEVEVFKLDFARKIWEKVGSLGENIALFYYGRHCCFSSSSMETGKGNSIYFIGCFSDNKNLYAFDLEDGSICRDE